MVMEVLTERENEFQSKTRGHVKERVIAFADREKFLGQQCFNTYDYVLTQDEERSFPPGSLDGKMLEVGINDMRTWQNRVQFRGKLGAVVTNGKAVVK